ncbi:MAG: DUF2723 domain-containing protein [Elusimicrobia bacterium]|nr:DUF2723 domain-containing protein [Elusimicrobiota bacterium]
MFPAIPAVEPFVVFLAFLLINVSSMAPSVTFGDSGELAAAAANLSLAHAPGYPLHALLGKALGAAVPWGGWAYRTNLLTAASSAAALAVLASALRLAGFSRTARLAGVLFLGLCGLWRHESSVTEVFGLHLLALSTMLWLAARFRGSLWEAKPAAAMGLAAGLGLANHHTLLLALPALGWPAIRRRVPFGRRWRGAAVAAAFLAMGMACYLYLPVRSAANPPLDWGHPTNLERFMRVLLRKDYGSFALTIEGAAPVSRWSQASRYARFTAGELGPAGCGLALIGLAAWPRLGLSLPLGVPVLLAGLMGPGFLALGNPPFDPQTSYALERFYLASWLGVAFLIAAGLESITSLSAWAGRALILVPVLSACSGFQDWSARWDLTAYDYGRNILKTLPRNAALFMDGGDDTFYSLAYLTQAQAMRPDLELHDRGGLVFRNVYGADFRRLQRDDKERRRLEIETPLAEAGSLFYSTLNDALLPGFRLKAVGLLRKPEKAWVALAPKKGTPPSDLWEFYVLRYSQRYLERHYRHRALIAFYPVMRAAGLAAAGRVQEAMVELDAAQVLAPDALWLNSALARQIELMAFEAFQRGDWPGAEAAFLRCVARAPGSVQAWRNLAAVYWSGSKWGSAAEAFRKASELAPGDRELAEYEAAARRKARP